MPGSTASSHRCSTATRALLNLALLRPLATVLGITGLFLFSLALYPLIGKAYFPRTDPGQFVINLKAPTGTRIELTDQLVEQVEHIVREVVPREGPAHHGLQHRRHAGLLLHLHPELRPAHRVCAGGLATTTTTSAASTTWTACASRLERELPQVSAYFQTGGLVDAILNLGMPAPAGYPSQRHEPRSSPPRPRWKSRRRCGPCRASATCWCRRTLITRRCNWTSIASAPANSGLNEKEVVGNVITALTSDEMIAPSYWVDPKTGNDYFLTVQYPEN